MLNARVSPRTLKYINFVKDDGKIEWRWAKRPSSGVCVSVLDYVHESTVNCILWSCVLVVVSLWCICTLQINQS